MPPQILYEHGPCLVIAKPGGLLTQAPPHIDSLEVQLKRFLKDRDHKPGNVYLAIIHRLDRPVSGAVVCARHVRAARRLSEQFEQRAVLKQYWAIVEGRFDGVRGTLRDHVRKVPDEPRAEIVSADQPDGREAILHYRVLEEKAWDTGELGERYPTAAERKDCSLLEIELETGRMHQIRLQLASRGHAILGDEQYGSAADFGPTSDDPRARCIALHARRIAFRHPMTRKPVDVIAPLPEYWAY